LKIIPETMKKYQVPQWLTYDPLKIEGKLSRIPTSEDVQLPSEVSTIFEHYSR
jgi:hypothetical protein